MPRAITRRCRGIAKALVNICRHHAFPAIFPIFILCPRPDRRRTLQPSPSKPAGEARREASHYFGGMVGFGIDQHSQGCSGASGGIF